MADETTQTTTQPPPPPPTDTPPVTAPAQDQAPAPPDPKTGADDPDIQNILTSLGRVVKPKEPPKAEPPAATAQEPNQKPPDAPESPAKPEEKGESKPEPEVAVRKERPLNSRVEDLVKQVLDDVRQERPIERQLEAKVDAGIPAATEDAAFIARLSPRQRRSIETAEFAEQHLGKTGLKKQWVDYWKKVEGYIQRESEKDPERKFDREDESYQRFVESARPQVDPDEWEDIEDKRKAYHIRQEVLKESNPAMEEIRRSQRMLEFRPQVERRAREVRGHFEQLLGTVKEDSPLSEVTQLLTESKGDWDAVEAADPFVAPEVRKELARAERWAAEYAAIGRQLVTPSNDNPVHVGLAAFIREQANIFEQRGGDRRVRIAEDGQRQTFVTPAKMAELAPEARRNHWTFNEPEVLSLIVYDAANRAEQTAKILRERFQKAGYQRQKTNGQPQTPAGLSKPPEPPKPTESPKAGTSLGPGAGNSTPPVTNPAMDRNDLAALGIGGLV